MLFLNHRNKKDLLSLTGVSPAWRLGIPESHHRSKPAWSTANRRFRIGLLCTGLIPLLLAGCGRQDIEAYNAPKDAPPPAQADPHAGMNMGMGGGMGAGIATDAAASPSEIRWEVPTGWSELPPGQMQVGQFSIADGAAKAKVTIIPLPGQAGGDLDNVNRWRGQVGLPPINAEELAKTVEKVEIAGLEGKLVDLAGADTDKPRMLAAFLYRDNMAWFFKMLGDNALVAKQKPVFVGFLKKLTFPAGSPAQAAPPAAEPPSAQAVAAEGSSKQAAPSRWKQVAPGAMQTAKYTIESAQGKAEVTVSSLSGDGGGVAPNVNRWRGQLGLPAFGDAELKQALQSPPEGAGEGYFVDLKNEASKRRMLAAGIKKGGSTWFYKMTGDEGLVESEKPAFLEYIKSSK